MRMSNGYLLAAEADIEAAREIGDGFGLDVIGAGAIGDHEAIGAALAGAANVGLVLSTAAAQDEAFVALLQSLAQRLPRAQLILVEPEARGAFSFLPDIWPSMSLDEARARSNELLRQRQGAQSAAGEPPAEPAPAAEDAPEAPAQPQAPPQPESAEAAAPAPAPGGEEQAPPSSLDSAHDDVQGAMRDAQEQATEAGPAEEAPAPPPDAAETPAEAPAAEPPAEAPAAGAPAEAPAAEPPAEAPAPEAPAAAAPAEPPAPEPPAPAAPTPPPMAAPVPAPQRAAPAPVSAPADATAFAPKKLRRETPELVRIVVHQPKDLKAVIKAARKIDPSATPAPQGMSIGEVALGASIGVALEVRGGVCDGTMQRRKWLGEPIDFAFTVDAEAGVKQAVLIARVFVDDAQIGVIAFTRPVKGPAKKPAGIGDRVRLKRHKRVFLSYSSQDREVVSAIATAYQMAGVEHFWDRASLKSGEEWSPRLRREIDRADLFHLCWSKSAASSEWVEREAGHALTRRRRSNGKKPDITVQMLDGPPWAPHPPSLASINFDDFVRAAIVGYARGEG
jgi:hypothetical protein